MATFAERDAALKEAAHIVGGITALSTKLGKSRAAASQWHRVPIKDVLAVEKLTGISRYRLRPDIYGPERPSRKNAHATA